MRDFIGVDNVNTPTKADQGALQTADNVVVTSNGRIRRRDGYATRLKSGSMHSVYGDNDICLYCSGNDLVRLHSDLSSITVLRSDITPDVRMAYLSLNNRIYYSNGIETGVIDNYVNRTWGLSTPTKPSLTATTGNLVEGRYQVVVTYVRNDGQISGASETSFIDVNDNAGIIVSVVASIDSTVGYINVYATSTNGEVFWFLTTLSDINTSFTINSFTQYSNIGLDTQFLDQPPAGNIIAYYNGRIYIAYGATVWYTEPYRYELINLADNYLMFASNVTMIHAVQDGLWLATDDETFFLAGPDVPFQKINKDNAGVIFGTSVLLDGADFGIEKSYTGPVVMWASVKYGFCAGLNTGQLVYMTVNKYVLPSTYSSGCGIIKKEDDGIQYNVSLKQ